MDKKCIKNKHWFFLSIYSAGVLLFSVIVKDWIATQTFAIIVTGAIVIWYTIEAQLLRRETQKQTEIQIRPFIKIVHSNRKFYLKNLGPGPSLNVKVRPVQVSSEESIIIKFDEVIPEINSGEMVEINAEGFHHGRSTGTFFLAHLDPKYANRNLSIFIDYQSIDLKTYTTRERVSPKKWEIVEFNY
jgi:hypothetical protein